MAKQTKRSGALGVAIQMEKEGIAFYTKAADQTKNPLGRKMFLSLVGDEQRHVRIFEELAAQEGVIPSAAEELDDNNPMKRAGSFFKAASKKTGKTASDDDIKAIDFALGMEKDAYFFYLNAAKAVSDPAEKEILQKIAEEENQHFRILNDTRLYLSYPEMWHIIQEKPLIDGG